MKKNTVLLFFVILSSFKVLGFTSEKCKFDCRIINAFLDDSAVREELYIDTRLKQPVSFYDPNGSFSGCNTIKSKSKILLIFHDAKSMAGYTKGSSIVIYASKSLNNTYTITLYDSHVGVKAIVTLVNKGNDYKVLNKLFKIYNTED